MNLNLGLLQDKIRDILINDVKKIIDRVRAAEDEILEEKIDGDSVTEADIQISRLLIKELTKLINGSIVIEEESFNKSIYGQINNSEYLWIVDPIDGTKAFRTKGNNEYCVAIALLHKGNPILSSVYAPEFIIKQNKGCLFEAREDKEGAYLNGEKISIENINEIKELKCINHVHRDTELNDIENKIANIFKYKEIIRAYEGHSTLVHYCSIIMDETARVFTRRDANIWDVIQAAYIIEKAGGIVMYPDGKSIIPVDFDSLIFKDEGKKLIFPFNIACPIEVRELILSALEVN